MPVDHPIEPKTDAQVTEQGLPHSGNLGLEQPVREFDNTPLSAAVDKGLVGPTPNTAEQLHAPKKPSHKIPLWAKIAAPLTAAGLLGGVAAVTASSGGGSSNHRGQNTEQSAAPSKAPETTPAKTFGNINLGAANLGADAVVATRPNGETIKIPRLDNSSPQTLGVSALDLLACYLTTGSNDCLTAFSTNAEVQKSLIDWRERDITPLLSNPANKDMQVVMFDDPDSPVNFTNSTASDGRELVQEQGGILYYGRHLNPGGSNEWQGAETRRAGVLESRFTSLQFYVATGSDGNPTIDGFAWNIQPVENN